MPNEKMQILKMLEEGKINSEEAAKLLNAIGTEKSTSRGNGRQSSTTENFDEFVSGLSKKIETFAKDVEPKLHKITEVVAEKTTELTDKLSKGLSTSEPAAKRTKPTGRGIEKRFELSVGAERGSELNLSTINGDVYVKGYNGDKITASVAYRPKRADAKLDFIQLGSKYMLSYDEDEFEFVSVNAFVPEKLFDIVTIATINGRLDVSTLSVQAATFSNSGGATKLSSIVSKTINVDCNNGSLSLSNVFSDKAQIENFNGTIDVTEIDIADLKLVAFNGDVAFHVSEYKNFSTYVWNIETSNGKMTISVPSAPDIGYNLRAHASLGNVRIGLSGLNYTASDSSFAEGKSVGYESARKRVSLNLETSNNSLVVN